MGNNVNYIPSMLDNRIESNSDMDIDTDDSNDKDTQTIIFLAFQCKLRINIGNLSTVCDIVLILTAFLYTICTDMAR